MTESNTLSVIIPCLNEERNLKELLPFLIAEGKALIEEIIVVDGGSLDNSMAVAKSFGATVVQSTGLTLTAYFYSLILGLHDSMGFYPGEAIKPYTSKNLFLIL